MFRDMALSQTVVNAGHCASLQRCCGFYSAMKNDVQTKSYALDGAVPFYLALRATPAPNRLRTNPESKA